MKFSFDRNEALYNLLTTRFEWFIESNVATAISCDIPLLGGIDWVFVSNFVDTSGKIDKTVVYISLKSPNFEKLQTYGLQDHLNSVYKGYVYPKTLKGYVFTLQVDLTMLPDDYEELAHQIACLRRELFAPVVTHFFNLQKDLASTDPNIPKFDAIEITSTAAVMIEAKPSGVTMTFALTFESNAEATMAKMFVEEFSRETNKCPTYRIFGQHEWPETLTDRHRLPRANANSNITYFIVNCRPSRSQNTVRKLALDLIVSLTAFIDSEIARIKVKLHPGMRELTMKCVKRMARAKPEVFADKLPEASFFFDDPKVYND